MKRSEIEQLRWVNDESDAEIDRTVVALCEHLLKADDALRWHEKWNKHWRPEDDAALLEDEGPTSTP